LLAQRGRHGLSPVVRPAQRLRPARGTADTPDMRALREAAAFLARRAGLRSERGWSLAETMIAISVASVVLGGATMILGGVASLNGTTERQIQAQETARTGMDSLATQLRNAIGPSGKTPIYSPASGSTAP